MPADDAESNDLQRRSCRNDRAVTQCIQEIAETRIRYGDQHIHALLLRKDWLINHNKSMGSLADKV